MMVMLVVGEVAAGLVVVVVLSALLLVLRLRSLTRRRGTFDCALRSGATEGEAWSFGVARTGSETVRWWRSRSFAPGPRWSARRSVIDVVSRQPVSIEGGGGGVVVTVSAGSQTVELLMDDDAYTGFAAWLESAAPRDRGVR